MNKREFSDEIMRADEERLKDPSIRRQVTLGRRQPSRLSSSAQSRSSAQCKYINTLLVLDANSEF